MITGGNIRYAPFAMLFVSKSPPLAKASIPGPLCVIKKNDDKK